jgi:hypothetical protein
LLALLAGETAPHRTLPVHLVERRSTVLHPD